MLSEERLRELMFPYSKVRDVQDKLILDVEDALNKKNHLVLHAPTGLGKTVSTLAPAIAFAKKKNLTIFFLTSRHTQHKIAIETIQEIKKEHSPELVATNIIGKRWLCLFPGIEGLSSHDFNEFCKVMKEDGKCEYYENVKAKTGKLKPKAQKLLEELKNISPITPQRLVELCHNDSFCPYEMSCALASVSNVIITDYYYLFNPNVMNSFFARTGKKLEECIIIVDEAHNLPQRIRELGSVKLSNLTLKRAVKEAKKLGYSDRIESIVRIQDAILHFSKSLRNEEENLVRKDDFKKKVGTEDEYDEIVSDFEFIGDEIREKQKKSYVGSIARFLDSWQGPDTGFARIISLKETTMEPIIELSYRCLDPSILTKETIDESYCTMMMSGTLLPTEMYKDLLGFPKNTLCLKYKNPFPEKNRLSLIVPKTTTKYTQRNDKQFETIAHYCHEIVEAINANTLIFFPSYFILDKVFGFFREKSKRKLFKESQLLIKEEKHELLEKFKEAKKQGGVLFAAISANFAEGIDLPGDLLKGVIIVGLPLQKPDLETKELIQYYQDKFEQGWDYGYIYPAFNKTLQSAGRCIRSETDRGVIVFLDERYAWPAYRKYFPEDYSVEICVDFKGAIKDFFS
ncbi:ATP-dependent DNA helicase [Candidatus Woesearchaeota archaeon]|nr:ATP-dependent DNA helicase [Candidatus Woesearchaeota archaeon]